MSYEYYVIYSSNKSEISEEFSFETPYACYLLLINGLYQILLGLTVRTGSLSYGDSNTNFKHNLNTNVLIPTNTRHISKYKYKIK